MIDRKADPGPRPYPAGLMLPADLWCSSFALAGHWAQTSRHKASEGERRTVAVAGWGYHRPAEIIEAIRQARARAARAGAAVDKLALRPPEGQARNDLARNG